jgi:hypothetical protein
MGVKSLVRLEWLSSPDRGRETAKLLRSALEVKLYLYVD